MAWKKHEYDKLPGTYVFDGRLSALGYPLNKMCMSFNDEINRLEFSRDEPAYCGRFGLTEEQIAVVVARDWLGMLRVGGNVYYLAKLATFSGKNMQDIGAQMSDVPLEEFKARLVAAGK